MKMRYYIEKATGMMITTPEELSGLKYQEVDPQWFVTEADKLRERNDLMRDQQEG